MTKAGTITPLDEHKFIPVNPNVLAAQASAVGSHATVNDWPILGFAIDYTGGSPPRTALSRPIAMKKSLLFFYVAVALPCAGLLLATGTLLAADPPGKLILKDSFDRTESDPKKEQVGNGWSTNSRSRAKGEKQVDLDGKAMHITRAAVADHGVSVVHDLEFKDAVIQLRFKLGKKDSLGINIADMKEKSVHAGHLCLALIRLNRVEIADLKTGRMNLQVRNRRVDGRPSPADKKMLRAKSKTFAVELAPDQWHQLLVQIAGDVMTVTIDGTKIGEFESPGIGHPTKRRLRLAVAKSASVDDVKVFRQSI